MSVNRPTSGSPARPPKTPLRRDTSRRSRTARSAGRTGRSAHRAPGSSHSATSSRSCLPGDMLADDQASRLHVRRVGWTSRRCRGRRWSERLVWPRLTRRAACLTPPPCKSADDPQRLPLGSWRLAAFEVAWIFLIFFLVRRLAAAGRGRIALSGQGQALLGSRLVRGRPVSRIARCPLARFIGRSAG